MRPASLGTLSNSLVIAICCVSLTGAADAQTDTARLRGRVSDRFGHAIRGAVIELTDADRGLLRVMQSDNTGSYLFPNVRPGNYRIQASAAGYQTLNVTDIEIVIQDNSNHNLTLFEGLSSETVTIHARGTPTDLTGSVSTIVDPTLATQLPLNGRSFQTLFQLVPGVVITATSFGSQGQFSVNGQRSNTNNVMVDGVSANVAIASGVSPGQSAGGSLPAVSAFGGTNSLISTDDVQEFAVLTSSYSAEFGRMPGAQVSIASRAGTQEFHGSLFNYLRNEFFDANDWFANKNNLKRAPLRQNDYGAVFGGPVPQAPIFFFASFEGLRLRQPTSSESDVPSIASRDSAPAPIKPFFNAYPLPTGIDQRNGLSSAIYGYSNPSSLDAASVRIDHHVGESIAIFARYSYSISDHKQRGVQVNSVNTVTNIHIALQTLTAGFTHFISQNMVNDLRFNWSEGLSGSADQLDGFGGAVPISPEQIFPSSFGQRNSLFQFAFNLDGRNRRLSLGRNISNSQHQINVVDNASYQVGSHLLKAGLDFRELSPQIVPAVYAQNSTFTDIKSALATMRALAVVGSSTTVQGIFRNYSAYMQDTWAPSARASVTFGVHWDYNPRIKARGTNGLQPFALRNIDTLPGLSLAPSGTPLYRSTVDNFAPRVGVAYQLRNASGTESVIRAGAGMFYDLGNGPAGNALDGTNFPFSNRKILLGVPFPLRRDDATPPALSTSGPLGNIVALPALLRLPYTYHWNVTLQQSLGTEQTLSFAYIASVGHSLLRTEQYAGGFAAVPQVFGQVLFTTNAGYSKYTSLQAQFVRRSKSGVHILASYSLSHSLDDISTDAVVNNIPARFLSRRDGYGPSDFDIRQTLTSALAYDLGGVRKTGMAAVFLSGWVIDAITIARSSPPVDVVLMRAMGFANYAFRPDLIPGVPRYVRDPNVPGGLRVNPAALAVPVEAQQGDLGRNSLRGFSLFETDLAIGRRFPITKRVHLQARAEAFNLFNHPNFSPPAGQLGRVDSQGKFFSQSGFGISQSMLGQGLQTDSSGSGFSPLYQIGTARSLQFAVKVDF